MKLLKKTMCLYIFPCIAFSSLQASVLIDFGTSTSGGSSPNPYTHGQLTLTNSSSVDLKNDEGEISPYHLEYKGESSATTSGVASLASTIATSITRMANAKAAWKNIYGYDITDVNLKSAIGGAGLISSPRISTYSLSGLTSGNTYTMSLFVYTSNIVSNATTLTFSGGTDVKMKHYKESALGVDLGLGVTNVSLVKGGEQMITIEFTANSTSANLAFNTPTGIGNVSAIQALAIKDTTKAVPEASTAFLGLFGLTGLMVRRRRHA